VTLPGTPYPMQRMTLAESYQPTPWIYVRQPAGTCVAHCYQCNAAFVGRNQDLALAKLEAHFERAHGNSAA
jgi:hypothetical protein